MMRVFCAPALGGAAGCTPDQLVTAAAEVAALGLLAWLAVLVLLGLLGRLPGAAGHVCAAVVDHLAPAAVRALVRAAFGLGVGVTVGGGVAGGCLAVAPASAVAVTQDGAHHDWPLLDRTGPVSISAPATYTVRPGDSLWSITKERLAPGTDRQIAQEWPKLWAANRHVIGANPDLIRPGQSLRVDGQVRR